MGRAESWGRVLRAAGSAALRDDLLTWAAALGFYFLFALFPAVLLLAALLHAFHAQVLVQNLVATLGRNLPHEAAAVVSGNLHALLANNVPGLLSLDIVLLFYSSSQGVASLMVALNAAYEVPEGRSFLHRLWLQFGLTIAVGILVGLALAVVVLGRYVLGILAGPVHLGYALEALWPLIRWAVTVGFMALAVLLLYRFAPNLAPHRAGRLPAVGAAMIIWVAASAVLAAYLNNFSNYAAVYGSLGAIIGLMLWFYFFALAILFGAEIHAHWLRQRRGIIPQPRNRPQPELPRRAA
jgi:membrane protein